MSLGALAVAVASPGLSLTARDFAIFEELYRHRVLSTPWLARRHFAGSQLAAWKRLRALATGGYVERLPTTHGEYRGHRLTTKGRRALGLETRAPQRPAGVGPVAVLHAMTVAEVADHTMRSIAPHDGTEFTFAWVTEQELLDGADWLPPGTFLPDGVVEATTVATGAVQRLAIEVELHKKADRAYAKKLAWYKKLLEAGALSRVRYYVGSTTVGTTLRRALRAAGFADDDARVEVRALPAAIPIYGHRAPVSRAP